MRSGSPQARRQADVPRYRLTIEYNGGPFAGWQRQEGQLTVQGVLEAAAEAIDGARVEVIGAGRTDAGVHALGQAAHLDMRKALPTGKLRDALNAHLRPHPVAVLEEEIVEAGFHARFDARQRSYEYRIKNRRSDLTLEKGKVWRVGSHLEAEAMHAAAQAFVGKHDFTTFRDANCQSESPVKSLDAISVARQGDNITVQCAARSFLHRQVRSMVGSLVEVGRGREPVNWIARILEAADRTQCGPVAPAEGLYLTDVKYAPMS
jgi:tRNA pseudouridine38-40 synthase